MYLILENYLTSEECDSIVERGKTLNLQAGQTWAGDEGSYRKSMVGWFNNLDNADIVAMIMESAQQYKRQILNFDIGYINDIQFTIYHGREEGGDKYDWHYDVNFDNNYPFDRKLSFVLQLVDGHEYEGGNFEFQDPYPIIDPNNIKGKGTVIVFPSFIPHRVTPVTAGTRISLVSWVEGPKFK